MQSFEPTTFTDGKILIRPFKPDDLSAFFEAVQESIPELVTWMTWCKEDYSLEDATTYIMSREEDGKTEGEYSFAICDAETGTFLGCLGINQVNRTYNFANLGYWVRSSRVGQGVASSATRLGARFGMEVLGLQRIEILAATANLASQRVAEKAGAKKEGVLRKRLLKDGQSRDAVVYSLVIEDLTSA